MIWRVYWSRLFSAGAFGSAADGRGGVGTGVGLGGRGLRGIAGIVGEGCVWDGLRGAAAGASDRLWHR